MKNAKTAREAGMKKGTRVTVKRSALVEGATWRSRLHALGSGEPRSRVGRVTGGFSVYRGRTYYSVRFSNGFTHQFLASELLEAK